MVKKSAPLQRKSADADNQESSSAQHVGKKATGLRIGAVILWLMAFGFEVLAILLANGTLFVPKNFPGDLTVWLIVALVLDLICVVIGSQIWKKANHQDPASDDNKVKFFLWNNMGVIAAIIAFVPVIIFLLKSKNLKGNNKTIVTVVAVVALLLAGFASYDYNPVSEKSMELAKSSISDGTIVYWTQWGRSYHLDRECQTIINSENVYEGTLDEAIAARRADPCDFCVPNHEEIQNAGLVEDTEEPADETVIEDTADPDAGS